MKKIFCLVCFFLALFSLKSIADVPEGAIPFVFDGHLYLQSTLNDTIPVTLIYDTHGIVTGKQIGRAHV